MTQDTIFTTGTILVNGEPLFQNVESIETAREVECERDPIGNLLKQTIKAEYQMATAANDINKEQIDKLCGYATNNPDNEMNLHIVTDTDIQVRKHKKRRINKKWAKKYGYKKLVVESGGWHFDSVNKDNEIVLCKKGCVI